MKRLLWSTLCLLSLQFTSTAQTTPLREGFLTPPAGGKAQTWWHWTSDFVTKEGITADLEAMHRVGYEAAHLFCTSGSATPPNTNYPAMLSPEWFDLLEFAAAEAKRLDIELGVHNCPGWSLSGGPWIEPEQAMQTIVSSECQVSGDEPLPEGGIRLPHPKVRHDYYGEIAVLAFPNLNTTQTPTITSSFTDSGLEALSDNDPTTYIRLPIKESGTSASVEFEYKRYIMPQFLEIFFEEEHLFVKGHVDASLDGKNYERVGEFDFKIRTDPKTPKYIELSEEALGANYYSITFEHRPYRYWMTPANVRVNGIRLLSSSMVENVTSRNSMMEENYGYKPFAEEYTTPGIDPQKIIDLSDKLRSDGTLDWTPPAGEWTILRFGHTCTGKENGPAAPQNRGLECDKLSKSALDSHWEGMMARIGTALQQTDVLKYAIVDSYEAGGQNWTAGLDKEFERMQGYSLKGYLPAVVGYVVGTPDQSARFLYDFQYTISELMHRNYYSHFADLCHQNGLKAITEAYFAPADYLRISSSADVPTGEFWILSGTQINRLSGSVGHVHGQRQIAAESFTVGRDWGRWKQDPRALKQYGDAVWIQGINQLVMHSYVHQPLLNAGPGMTLGVHGSHLNRHNTWWNYAQGWVSYLNRAQFLLQQGTWVADLLELAGEANPNRDDYPIYKELLAAGYNYDFLGVDDLWESLGVEQGRITVPSGGSYTCLSLGRDPYLSIRSLERIEQLLEAGATVAGARPKGTPTLKDDPEAHQALVDRIWGDTPAGAIKSVGSGRLVVSNTPLEILSKIECTPDVVLPDRVRSLHRTNPEAELYFIYNDSTRYITTDARFRLEGSNTELVAEFWDADKGTMQVATTFRTEGDYLVVPMRLAPRESRFVVVRSGSEAHLSSATLPEGGETPLAPVTLTRIDGAIKALFSAPAEITLTPAEAGAEPQTIRVKSVPEPLSLDESWSVAFQENRGAPEQIELPKLISLSEHSDEGVRYFAGVATYTKSFTLPKKWQADGRKQILDLGELSSVAKVWVNDKEVALLWHAPFTTDLSDYLQQGENTLKIEVATRWCNRLIGDANNPNEAPSTEGWPDWVLADQPNSGEGHYSYSSWKGWRAGEELLEAGLIGPVRLHCLEVR